MWQLQAMHGCELPAHYMHGVPSSYWIGDCDEAKNKPAYSIVPLFSYTAGSQG